MNSAFLLQLLMQQAPTLLQALKSKPVGTFPNIENSIADAVEYGGLENQYRNAYNHISSDLVPDSTNIEVALGNLDKSLGTTNPISMEMPNRAFTNQDTSRQDADDIMQRKINLNALRGLWN